MNKELLEEIYQKSFSLYQTGIGFSDMETIERSDLEKFAAMIIQECINLDFSDVDYISIEGENRVRDIIKEHFGVE